MRKRRFRPPDGYNKPASALRQAVSSVTLGLGGIACLIQAFTWIADGKADIYRHGHRQAVLWHHTPATFIFHLSVALIGPLGLVALGALGVVEAIRSRRGKRLQPTSLVFHTVRSSHPILSTADAVKLNLPQEAPRDLKGPDGTSRETTDRGLIQEP